MRPRVGRGDTKQKLQVADASQAFVRKLVPASFLTAGSEDAFDRANFLAVFKADGDERLERLKPCATVCVQLEG